MCLKEVPREVEEGKRGANRQGGMRDPRTFIQTQIAVHVLYCKVFFCVPKYICTVRVLAPNYITKYIS